MLDFVSSCCLRSEPADGGSNGWTPDGDRFVTAPLGSYGPLFHLHAAPGSLTEPLTPIAITDQSPGVSALSEKPPGNLVRSGARAAITGPRRAMPDPPLQGSNGRTNGRCLTLQVRDGIHWALSGSVHDPKYEEGHSQQHSQQHSQKHSQRQVSGDFFGDDFTANLTGDLTGNLTGAAQSPLVAISEIARLIRTMGYSGSDVPRRDSGLASRFLRDRCRLGEYESVVPVGSTSISRTSRTSSSLPSVRTRSCMVGGCTGLPTRRRNATRERDSGASRPATGRSTPSRLTTRWGRALASPFGGFHLPLSVPVSHTACRSAS